MTLLGIEFIGFSPEVDRRIWRMFDSIKKGKTPPDRAIDMLIRVISEFICAYEGDPEVCEALEAIVGKKVAVSIPGVADATGTLLSGGEVEIEDGIDRSVPLATVYELDTLYALLTGKLSDVEAIMSKKIEIKGLAQIIRWIAPFVALQNKKRNEHFRKNLEHCVDKVLKKSGF